jgi:hypothetical protein
MLKCWSWLICFLFIIKNSSPNENKQDTLKNENEEEEVDINEALYQSISFDDIENTNVYVSITDAGRACVNQN